MADNSVRVEVTGLKELSRAFKAIDPKLALTLKGALKDIADEVITVAVRKFDFTTRSGNAQASLKARSGLKGAGIAFGGAKAPYYPWLDFGGAVGRSRSVQRTVVRGGRYVYPAIGDSGDMIRDKVGEAVEKAAEGAGFEVRGK